MQKCELKLAGPAAQPCRLTPACYLIADLPLTLKRSPPLPFPSLPFTLPHFTAFRPEFRYCELTSWNIEIKCRHRNLRVESVNKEPESNDSRHSAGSDFSVIGATIDSVRQLEPPSGQTYEAQVFDLRALTNYTFQVQVSRFAHELETDPEPAKRWQPEQHDRSQAARRLSLSNQKGNGLLGRVETKPFGAEATKCLADVSEVVVNTGRYFGGRISVEDSLDPRCNLLGNRSSEQTTYLFRIDHQICDSKIVVSFGRLKSAADSW